MDRIISCDPRFCRGTPVDYSKIWNLAAISSSQNNASDGSHVALSQQLLGFLYRSFSRRVACGMFGEVLFVE